MSAAETRCREASVIRAAMSWWRGKRPLGWEVNDHIAAPCVNCVGVRESRLAVAVAKMVEAGCGGRRKR